MKKNKKQNYTFKLNFLAFFSIIGLLLLVFANGGNFPDQGIYAIFNAIFSSVAILSVLVSSIIKILY